MPTGDSRAKRSSPPLQGMTKPKPFSSFQFLTSPVSLPSSADGSGSDSGLPTVGTGWYGAAAGAGASSGIVLSAAKPPSDFSFLTWRSPLRYPAANQDLISSVLKGPCCTPLSSMYSHLVGPSSADFSVVSPTVFFPAAESAVAASAAGAPAAGTAAAISTAELR